MTLDPSLLALLRCPLCKRPLQPEPAAPEGEVIRCPEAHRFPVVEGVPLLAPEDRLRR